jgi:hypothetical protein
MFSVGTENQSILVSIGSINHFVGRYLVVERVVLPTIYAKTTNLIHRSKKLGHLLKLHQIRDENNLTFMNQLSNEYNSIEKEKSDYLSSHKNPNCEYGCDHFLWDIALVKVKHRIVPVFNETHFKVNSVCLPKSGITNNKTERAVIMGMGLTEQTKPSNLKKGITIILNNSISFCKQRYCIQRLSNESNPLLNSSQLTGDSGSPVIQYHICRAVQIGIISRRAIVNSKTFGLETSVPIFMPWIRWVILSNDIMIISETNVLLILSVITTAIIAVIVSFALLWSKT